MKSLCRDIVITSVDGQRRAHPRLTIVRNSSEICEFASWPRNWAKSGLDYCRSMCDILKSRCRSLRHTQPAFDVFIRLWRPPGTTLARHSEGSQLGDGLAFGDGVWRTPPKTLAMALVPASAVVAKRCDGARCERRRGVRLEVLWAEEQATHGGQDRQSACLELERRIAPGKCCAAPRSARGGDRIRAFELAAAERACSGLAAQVGFPCTLQDVLLASVLDLEDA